MTSVGQQGETDRQLSVEQLGRRARERLHEEQKKRPEIVRISQLPEKESAPSKLLLPSTRPKGDASPRKKRRPSTRTSNSSDSTIDRWLPNLSVVDVGEGETRSRLVRLHGLPLGTEPSHIRRFFSGLEPQRIMLLPSYSQVIPSWDANHSVPRKSGKHIERYDPTLRVFVQFDSAPTAEAAATRSAEVLEGCAIAATVVPKLVASYLVKHMVLEAVVGQSLHRGLQHVEEELDPLVPQLLWSAATLDLGLNHQIGLYPFGTNNNLALFAQDDVDQLSARIRQLQNDLARLLYKRPLLLVDLDPELAMSDPIVRLTTSAANRIKAEIALMDNVLRQSKLRKL